jgi:3-hydroxyacyl-CoA dehydrogenase/3a,7a,12a-trihydroxy-5b-cholest-24-enoyl-CoA hydratase
VAATAPAATLTRDQFTCADIFTGIEDHIVRHPELVSKIGKVFVFKLTSPDSAWTIDVKNGSGGVQSGAGQADCTLELSNADFMDMTGGKADAMKLYMGGKLKITGDVMASQKLDFLKKIDPKQALEAVTKKKGAAAPAAQAAAQPAAASTAPAAQAKAPAILKALGERLAKSPALAKEYGSVLQLNVKNPDGSWVIDLTGAGSVREGTDAKATTVLRIDDGDLVALTKDPSQAQSLYQHGKLRVDGDVRPATKLSFLKDLV